MSKTGIEELPAEATESALARALLLESKRRVPDEELDRQTVDNLLRFLARPKRKNRKKKCVE